MGHDMAMILPEDEESAVALIGESSPLPMLLKLSC